MGVALYRWGVMAQLYEASFLWDNISVKKNDPYHGSLFSNVVGSSKTFISFYRAMHFSAKRGIVVVCCLCVCLSVRDALHCGS